MPSCLPVTVAVISCHGTSPTCLFSSNSVHLNNFLSRTVVSSTTTSALHAVTMTTTQGIEVLIHIGLDTVNLKGEPFTAHVKAGDKVKQGDPLMDVDLGKIQAAGLNIITPVLICNTDDYKEISLQKQGEVTLADSVLKIS